MANQIYDVTHEGLSAVISAKAATHVLRKAIEAQGHNYKSITGSEMRDVLLGPVYRELTTILPKDGVDKTLKQIIKNLKKQIKAARAAKEITEDLDDPPASAEELSLPAAHHAEIGSSESESITTESESVVDEKPNVLPQHASAETTSKVETPARPAHTEPNVARVYNEQQLADFLMGFAQVENIKIVAIVQNNGVIKQSRGSGFDLAAISRIGSMGLKLLSRGRRIHSFYLSNQKGQLFLFPLADHTLIVVGNSEVNVGEVFSTLSTLEESI